MANWSVVDRPKGLVLPSGTISAAFIPTTKLGAPDGVATLDANKKIPLSQLPDNLPSGGGTGPAGPKGDPGERGLQGIPGAPGLKGDKGDIGEPSTVPGPKGDPGLRGLQGEVGPVGPASTVAGPKGDPGTAGLKGDKGDTGATGAASTVAGPQGVPGERGPQGEVGPAGAASTVAGPKGDPGTAGLKGDQGIQGLKGDTGATGPAGAPLSALAPVGYSTGAGGAVTQLTSRVTGVTLSKASGSITLFSKTTTANLIESFIVTNTLVAATDTINVAVKATGLFFAFVTDVAAGSFRISIFTPTAQTAQAPVVNFAIIKAVAA